jgi:hypothetical protein
MRADLFCADGHTHIQTDGRRDGQHEVNNRCRNFGNAPKNQNKI